MTNDGLDSVQRLWRGRGAYTVSEVCRILQPTMTRRKVHYWLDTGLLSDAIVHGRRGVPTLLTFRQLLEIRTVQHLREELEEVRDAISYLLHRLFAEDWTRAHFAHGVHAGVVVRLGDDSVNIESGQGVLDATLPELDRYVEVTREAWERQRLVVEGFAHVTSNAKINAGAPCVTGTRIPTSMIAQFGDDGAYTDDTAAELRRAFPQVQAPALIDALRFEGLRPAA